MKLIGALYRIGPLLFALAVDRVSNCVIVLERLSDNPLTYVYYSARCGP